MDLNRIFENDRNWINEKKEIDENYFTKLADGQNPDLLYIGCSDSRATAEHFMGTDPGDVFVHRNIANVVANDDINALSVINYAVVHLSVDHIIICGHYGCGGVKAAMAPDDLGIITPWLKHIRDVYRLHKDELEAIGDEDKRYKRLVELNIQEQCINTLKIPEVQQAFGNEDLTIHGWVFDLQSGKLIDLNIDTEALFDELKDIYSVG